MQLKVLNKTSDWGYISVGFTESIDGDVTLNDVINCEFLEEGIYFINVLGYKQIIKFIKN